MKIVSIAIAIIATVALLIIRFSNVISDESVIHEATLILGLVIYVSAYPIIFILDDMMAASSEKQFPDKASEGILLGPWTIGLLAYLGYYLHHLYYVLTLS